MDHPLPLTAATLAATGPAARAMAMFARYGAPGRALPDGPWNTVLDQLAGHRSIRAYRPDPLAPGTLEAIVAAAQSAATSSNMQTWSVVAVVDPAIRARLARIASNQAHITECPLFLVFLADLSRLGRVAHDAGTVLEGLPFLETFLVAAMDAAIAAQNAAVAAESLGLGTVYIGAIRNDPGEVAEALGLPAGAVAVTGLCIGHIDTARDQPGVKPRLPQAAVLHHDRYDAADRAARDAYDTELEAFSARSERSSYTWTQRVIGRLGRMSALSGREGLKATLNRLGLPLR